MGFPSLVLPQYGSPSVSTINKLALSGRSPPAAVNSSSLAISRARSVWVFAPSTISSSSIFFSRSSSFWYFEPEKLNTIVAFWLNVINPKWSPFGAGLNALIRTFTNPRTTLRFAVPTLADLSRIIPMSSPALQVGSVEIEKQVNTCNLDHLSHSLSICSTLWDNYAYFLSIYQVSASSHTSKPFKCKSLHGI